MATNTHAQEIHLPSFYGGTYITFYFWSFELQYTLLFPKTHTIIYTRNINTLNIDIPSIGKKINAILLFIKLDKTMYA